MLEIKDMIHWKGTHNFVFTIDILQLLCHFQSTIWATIINDYHLKIETTKNQNEQMASSGVQLHLW